MVVVEEEGEWRVMRGENGDGDGDGFTDEKALYTGSMWGQLVGS